MSNKTLSEREKRELQQALIELEAMLQKIKTRKKELSKRGE